jgi:DNA-binding beta-propeller fold protein YncE
MVEAREKQLAVLGAIVLLAGCRAIGGVTPSDGGVAEAAVDAGEAATGPPTRLEPPVVTPAPDVVVETVAGSETRGAADGIGPAAQFDNPVGVFLDPSGELFVTEYDGRRLRKVTPSGATTTLATGLPEPFALVVTEDAIYVQTDRAPNEDKGPTTGTLWRVPIGGGVPELFLETNGLPRGMARLLDGRVVMSDRERHTLSIVDLATKTVTPLAGSGAPGFADGLGATAQLNDPYGLAVLPDGAIVVADSGNNVIRKVTLEGEVTLFAGDGNPGMRDHADRRQARFDFPQDVAVDAAGNVFVADRLNHRIRRIASDDGVETVAGDGTPGYADGPGPQARFFGIEQIDVSPDGKTVFASDGNRGDGASFHRIRKITIP